MRGRAVKRVPVRLAKVARMSAEWTWQYLDAEGTPMSGAVLTTRAFPTQGDAENWIGESWRDLLDSGVESVTLLEGESVVYGPMSLRAAE